MTELQDDRQIISFTMRDRRRKRAFWQHRGLIHIAFLALLSLPFLSLGSANSDSKLNQQHGDVPMDFLDENSVVLITGIAGFIGSELALAVHRVYSPKKIIGVDSMDDGFGQTQGRTGEELGVFDFKRQRLFHVLQTVSPTFYRVDFRPNIPDYQDLGEVPVLDHIFSSNPDITHVVHLADPYGLPSILEEGEEKAKLKTQAVPRKKEQIKAGMMEALLEQLNKAGRQHPQGRIPHFTYASSGHVYNHYNAEDDEGNLNPPPFTESKPITTPSSIHGASKVLDEILAKAYHETRGIYSVGLRLFDVYGPWGSPGSFLFDLAERAVRGGEFVQDSELLVLDKASRDYVYIDDAVDALLGAMQFRPLATKPEEVPAPVVINVGTGQATTVRTIIRTMQKFLMNTVSVKLPPRPTDTASQPRRSISYASTARAKDLLGFESQVPLEEGIFHLLAWHHDRAFPYGSLDESSLDATQHPLETLGMVACSPLDPECLKGAPVFPCASECSNRHQCTASFYDSVIEQTQQWTEPCEAVLYTVNLDDDLKEIPSATAAVSSTSVSSIQQEKGHCNLAFVSSTSPLVQKLQQQNTNQPLKHGFWTLVQVDVNEGERDFYLEFLPKLSPGNFFGGGKTQRIIYCDPDVIIDSIPNLLAEAAMQPLHQPHKEDDQKNDGGSRQGATAMLIGKGRESESSRKGHTPLQEAVQDMAYRSVRISLASQMSSDGFALPLDSSFIVHTLQSEDSRLFRCDVFAELIQWEVGTDQTAFEFILELHDMWSSVIAKKAGLKPWWVGEGVVTVPERRPTFSDDKDGSLKRRLLEVQTNSEGVARGAQLVKVQNQDEMVAGAIQQVSEDGNQENVVSGENQATPKRDANFGDGDDRVGEDHTQNDGSAELIAARKNEDKDDDAIVDDDTNEDEGGEVPLRPEIQGQERDVSAYDTWMGVLSSTSLQYFVRIVPSDEAGVVVIDDTEF